MYDAIDEYADPNVMMIEHLFLCQKSYFPAKVGPAEKYQGKCHGAHPGLFAQMETLGAGAKSALGSAEPVEADRSNE